MSPKRKPFLYMIVLQPCLAALNPQSDSIMTERERMEERRRRRMGGGGGDDNQSGSEGSSV